MDGTPTTRYVTSDYQIDIPTGEATVFYRFGGRTVAWHNDTTLRYTLTDHLSSTRGEANADQSEGGQRRYLPFGGDRPVTGANDLGTDERYAGQKRIEAGASPDSNCELYYYGARWYLPGVGIFTQPDSVVPNYANPQAVNRYSYTLNNPLRYNDPTGHYVDWGGEDGGWGDDGRGDGGYDGSGDGGYDDASSNTVVPGSGIQVDMQWIEAGQDADLSNRAAAYAYAIDFVDTGITTSYAAGLDALSAAALPLGPEAAATVYESGNMLFQGTVGRALMFADIGSAALNAYADWESGRTRLPTIADNSISVQVGTDSLVGAASFALGLIPDVNVNAGADLAQTSYDLARATNGKIIPFVGDQFGRKNAVRFTMRW